jgi:hypothetical protein
MATISMTAAEQHEASVRQSAAITPPVQATLPGQPPLNVPGVGTLDDLRQEIDDAYEEMRAFIGMEPDQVMQICAGHTARLNEIRTRVIRVEDFIRQLKPVRTNEIEPTIKELQFQFQVASRLFAVRQLDWDMVRGSGT